jgi:hypothetical protein
MANILAFLVNIFLTNRKREMWECEGGVKVMSNGKKPFALQQKKQIDFTTYIKLK